MTTVAGFLNGFREKYGACPICGCIEFSIGGEFTKENGFAPHVICDNPECRADLSYEFGEIEKPIGSQTSSDINFGSRMQKKLFSTDKTVREKTGTDLIKIAGIIVPGKKATDFS